MDRSNGGKLGGELWSYVKFGVKLLALFWLRTLIVHSRHALLTAYWKRLLLTNPFRTPRARRAWEVSSRSKQFQ